MKIRHLVQKLINTYGTLDPFKLSEIQKIEVIHEYLGKFTWGYYSHINRISFIHIHESLSEAETRFTCAHELGHHYLHPKVNTPFLKKNTLLSLDKIEREANQFAVELLIPDQLLIDGMTVYQAAEASGVPGELATLKKPPAYICRTWVGY